jgi:hypothetical protein
MTQVWFTAVLVLVAVSLASAVAMSRTVSHELRYGVLALIASSSALVLAFFPPA